LNMDKVRRDLSDLIEFPLETQENEYKGWIDLDDKVVRASIASHLAALANHGGGHLVFGFQDDLTPDPNRPASIDKYNRDTFTGIVKRYLSPYFQCDVHIVTNKKGEEFPVVRVPAHENVPIMAKADGPQDRKKKPQGIMIGKCYIRKPGPESAPIDSSQEWSALIRRCTLNDRTNLLKDFANIIRPTEGATPNAQQQLENWHQKVDKRFLDSLSKVSSSNWPVPFKDNRYQLSYLISSNGEELSLEQLKEALMEVQNDTRNMMRIYGHMFYQWNDPSLAPVFCPEEADGTGGSVLEGNLIKELQKFPEFWRVAPDGRASLIRPYLEDRSEGFNDIVQEVKGPWFSPETIVRETGEFVIHAMLLAKRFESATQVSFRCTWIGLEDREIAEFNSSVCWRSSRKARVNKRTTEKTYTTAELTAKWSTIVSDLACPVLYVFGLNCGVDFVENMKQKFIIKR